MKIEDAYIGLKVKAHKHDFHERFPHLFPKEGTKGKIIAIDDCYDLISVKWKSGSTSLNDTWYVPCEYITPLKNKNERYSQNKKSR